MALTPEQRVFQAQVMGALEPYPVSYITQAQVISVYNYPALELRITQAQVIGPVTAALTMRTSQAQVIAVVKGRIENRKIRAWTFSLDGHDFYVLRLGESGTIVYDKTTKQWSEWKSQFIPVWRAHTGMNWLGMGPAFIGQGATSAIVAGDDTLGLLWFVVPEQGYDEHPLPEGENTPFTRKVTGGLPGRMRVTETCSAIYLTAALGSPQYDLGAADIVLRTSDDFGETWAEHGAITINPGEWDQEISWRSLGLIKHPGRIFEVEDDGATVRIDGMDMWSEDADAR